MARGTDAKNEVISKMQEAFGADWIGEVDKKYYVWAKENGERLQIAITLTCPKTMVEVQTSPNYNNKMNFEDPDPIPPTPRQTEISKEEIENLNVLMARLGL